VEIAFRHNQRLGPCSTTSTDLAPTSSYRQGLDCGLAPTPLRPLVDSRARAGWPPRRADGDGALWGDRRR
jgi:hypothetical protein